MPLPDSKPEDSFLQCDIPQTNCHAELFFRTKKLDKSELKATITQYIRRSYERKAGAQRQFVKSPVKRTEIRNSRLCSKIKKILNQSSIIRKESNDVNSGNESSWEDLDINDFEESWQERKLPINLRRKTSYLRPPSKKIKFDFNKKSGETKKKTKKYVKPSINFPVLNKTTSLPSDTKTVTSDSRTNAAIEEDEKIQELFLAFRKHYVKNIAEATDDPKDIQFTFKQYWNNLPTAENEHFSQSSPSTRVNETFCFCKIRKHEKSKMELLFACDIYDNWYH